MEDSATSMTKVEEANRTCCKYLARFTRQLINYRYGIGMLVALSSWVGVAYFVGPQSVIGNALRLDTYGQIVFVTAVNFLAIAFCVSILRTLNDRYPPVGCLGFSRFLIGDGSNSWGFCQWSIVIALSLVTPIWLLTAYGSEFSGWIGISGRAYSVFWHSFHSIAAIVIGVILGWMVLRLIGCIKSRLFGSHKGIENYFPYENVNQTGCFQICMQKLTRCRDGGKTCLTKVTPSWLKQWGVSVAGWFTFEPIDIQLGLYALVLFAFHFLSTRWFADVFAGVVSAPAVMIIVFWIGGMFLTGVAYGCDKLRIPVVLLLFLFMSVSNFVLDRDSTVQTVTDRSNSKFLGLVHKIRNVEVEAMRFDRNRREEVLKAIQPLEMIAWSAIQARMKRVKFQHESRGKTAVLITCPGGGIHAAAWSTCVLEDLCKKFPNFRDSISVVSGVSGGSVGTLYFVSATFSDTLGAGETLNDRKSAFDLATSSSLEHIAFGMMTDDLYGAFIPSLNFIDRGQRLENSFLGRLPGSQRKQTLGDWGDKAMAGELPIVIFNATDAVTGRRVLFDSIPTPLRKSNVTLTSRPFNYRELLQYDPNSTIDISPATAARVSASFPYVSTFSKPDLASEMGLGVALGDGGYVDNEGIVTTIDWTQFILEKWASSNEIDRAFDRILILRIIPSINSDSLEPPNSGALARNLRWLTGPLETIANVRGTSQAERGNLETDLATLYLSIKSDQSTLSSSLDLNSKTTASVTEKSPALKKAVPAANRTREDAARSRFLERMKKIKSEFIEEIRDEPVVGTTSPPVGAVVGPELIDDNQAPIIVIEIPFDTDSSDKVVPLNWKLTRDQKTWYQDAWTRVQQKQPEDMQTLELLFGDASRN